MSVKKLEEDNMTSLPFGLEYGCSAYNNVHQREDVDSTSEDCCGNGDRTSAKKKRLFIASLVSIMAIASGAAIVIFQKNSTSPDVNKTSMEEQDRLLEEPVSIVTGTAKKTIDQNKVVAFDASLSMSMDFSLLAFSMPLPTKFFSMPLDSLSMSMFSLSPEENSFGTGGYGAGGSIPKSNSKGKKKGPKYPKSIKSPKPTITYDFCDKDALPAELTRLSSLENDRFYKLCPGLQKSNGLTIPLGQPRCGDNSNYSFFLTRPNDGKKEKIIIEFSGGGACWDVPTCTSQAPFLTFPTILNSYVGSSCASFPDVLCSKKIGDVDLSEYNFMFIPYCTQDVHLGDASISSYGIQHVGGHNLYRTLSWVFENYPDPKHIFLTGCSAGATVLPVVYDMINKHYERKHRKGNAGVTIDVIADSSVFLTPLYFVVNGLPNWNIGTLTKMIDFDYDASTDKTEFSVDLLAHVLQRSKVTDDVGYSFHDDDKISQYYYMLMSGVPPSELLDSNGESPVSSMSESGDSWVIPYNDTYHSLNDPDLQSLWWTQLTSSITRAGNGHSNFQVFYMNGPEHCTYGLNIALPYEGFEEWASNILQFDTAHRGRVFRRRG